MIKIEIKLYRKMDNKLIDVIDYELSEQDYKNINSTKIKNKIEKYIKSLDIEYCNDYDLIYYKIDKK